MKQKKVVEHATISLKGGRATLKKHGKEHYRRMAQKRWKKASK